MSTLLEIEAAAEMLPPEQQAELVRFVTARLKAVDTQPRRARVVRQDDDVLLEAPPGAPPMTGKPQADARELAMSWLPGLN